MRGVVARYELMTTAPAAAAAFYGQVLGWTTESSTDGQTSFVGAGGPFASVSAVQRRMLPQWLSHITVESLPMALEMAETLGGLLMSIPAALPGLGRHGLLRGPGGSLISVVELSDAPMSSEGDAVRAAVAWNESTTLHFEDDWNFLSGLFGWLDRGTMTHPDGRQYRMFGRTHEIGDGLGGHSTLSADLSAPSWVIYFSVPDLSPALVAVRAQGGRVTSTPMQLPNGDWVVRCLDPQGAVFALLSTQKS